MELIFDLLIMGVLLLGLPVVSSGLVWLAFGLWKERLRWWGAVMVFIPGALTGGTWYGHRGPVWLLQLLWSNVDGQALSAGLWMLGSGLSMVFVFGLMSLRESLRPPDE